MLITFGVHVAVTAKTGHSCRSRVMSKVGCGDPHCPRSCEKALVACRQDHLGVVNKARGSQIDTVKAAEVQPLGQPSGLSNKPLGDLDHVELIVQILEVVDCLAQPALVDSVESAGRSPRLLSPPRR